MTLPDTIVNTLPQALPLEQAARLAGLHREDLEKMVQLGQVVAFRSPEGHILIPVDAQGKPMMTAPQPQPAPLTQNQDDDINARLRRIRREQFAHLEGVPITVSEAARKYRVQRHTILAWTRRYPFVLRVLERGYRLLIDEAGVAYLAAIHHARKNFGIRSGSPLVDSDGSPNLIKHPTLSAYRKQHFTS